MSQPRTQTLMNVKCGKVVVKLAVAGFEPGTGSAERQLATNSTNEPVHSATYKSLCY